jgi:hypothetical protein
MTIPARAVGRAAATGAVVLGLPEGVAACFLYL